MEKCETLTVDPAKLRANVENFILRYLLPLPVVRRSYKLRLFTEKQQKDIKSRADLPREVNDIVFIGSQYEGLSVTVTRIDGGDAIYAMSDYDTMPVLKHYLVVEKDAGVPPLADGVEKLQIFPASHPGYCKLKSIRTGKFVGMRFNEDCSGKVDVYNDGELVENITIPYKEIIPGFFEMPDTLEITTYVHGPAISCTKIQIHPGEITRTGQEVDVVLSMKCHIWPSVATEWLNRKRHHWPTPETMEKVANTGCFVVAVAHPLSAFPEGEWRYSFAPVEKILARNFTFAQKGSYIVAKMLFKSVIDKEDQVSSYCLKTQMFWLCENETASSWKYDSIGHYALKVLSQLAECLNNSVLQQFIIPENNIVDHIPETKLQGVSTKLRELVRNPLPIISRIRRTTKYFGSIIHPPESAFQPITTLLGGTAVTHDEMKERFTETRINILQHYCSMLTKSISNPVQEEFAKVKFALLMDLAEDMVSASENTNIEVTTELIAKELAKCNIENVSRWREFAKQYTECRETIKREDVENIITHSYDGILKVEAF